MLVNKEYKRPHQTMTREVGMGNLVHHVKAYLKEYQPKTYWKLHQIKEIDEDAWYITASPAIANQIHAFVHGYHASNAMIKAEPIDA